MAAAGLAEAPPFRRIPPPPFGQKWPYPAACGGVIGAGMQPGITRAPTMAVCEAALDGGWTALMPVGVTLAIDGRRWELDNVARVIAASSLRHAVVDFDHGADKALGRSEAAGWIEELSAEAMPGFLAARIAWTPPGAAALAERLYRFISPVIQHDRAGRVVRILRAGLTNRPAIAELPALATEGETMPETDTDPTAGATVTAEAVAALQAELAIAAEACAKASAERDQALATVAELTAAIDAAHAEAEAKDRAQLIATAAREGRVVPAMDAFLATLSREQLGAFLASAPVIVSAAAAKPAAAHTDGALTERQEALCRQLGITADAFRQTKGLKE